MEVLQWTMTIPQNKQEEFIKYYNRTLKPTWLQFGAIKCELFKTSREKISGENSFPKDQFVEILYLKDKLSASEFFERVKAVPKAWDISRQYEKRFGARNIIMKVLQKV